MIAILTAIQIAASILMIMVILVQNRAGGLSDTFGGSGTFQPVKRGAEKVIAITTIVLAITFLGTSLAISLLA